MEFFKGERIRCLGRPEWGTGFVIADSCHNKVQVRFQLIGEVTLSLRHAKLMKVKPPRSGSTTGSEEPQAAKRQRPSPQPDNRRSTAVIYIP